MTTSEATAPGAHLSDHALAVLRSLLLCQIADNADQAADSRATAEWLTGQTDSDSVLERELAEASALSFSAAVVEARAALRRLDEGTYGICDSCGRAIPFERLEAIPYARRCVACPAAPPGPFG